MLEDTSKMVNTSRIVRPLSQITLGSPPAVSVLMPVYNTEKYVAEAVDSILAQTFGDFEFVIVNDGSTDGTLRILEEYAARDQRIVLLSRPNTGMTRALNDGLAVCRGEFIARMDADDISESNRLEVQIAYLQQHPDVVVVGADYRVIDEKGRVFSLMRHATSHSQIVDKLFCGSCSINHPSVVVRKAAIEAVGGYDERYVYGQDYDLWLRLSEKGVLANLDHFLMRYRHHECSITGGSIQKYCEDSRNAWRAAVVRRNLHSLQEPTFRPWRANRQIDTYTFMRHRAKSAFRIGEYYTGAIYTLKAAGYLSLQPKRLYDMFAGRVRRGFRKRAHFE